QSLSGSSVEEAKACGSALAEDGHRGCITARRIDSGHERWRTGGGSIGPIGIARFDDRPDLCATDYDGSRPPPSSTLLRLSARAGSKPPSQGAQRTGGIFVFLRPVTPTLPPPGVAV